VSRAAEPFRLTTGRWHNRYDPETGRTAKAPCYLAGFTYDDFEYGGDYPAAYLPEADPPESVQTSLICAPSTFLLVIDVDHPEQLGPSATGQLVSWHDAMSVRGSHFHVGVDMRGARPQDWPLQGRTPWGDVKSNGFVAAPGSVHYGGEPYARTSATVQERLVGWTPELLSALAADKAALVAAKRAEWGIAAGARLDGGGYLYASGYTGGSWEAIPDGGLRHDDELKDLLWDMHVEYGRDEAECRAQWERLAGALGKPWTERDFTRHWHRVPARRLDRLEDDDAYKLDRDFGLRVLPPAVEQEYSRQQADWEQRAKAAADEGRQPPTPVPADGPFEDPGDPGADLFDWNLGVGAYQRPFDAGPPSDSDNARAVLSRIGGVCAYLTDRGIWLKRVGARWDDQELGANLRPVLAAVEEVMPAGCADPVKVLDLDADDDAPQVAALKAQAKNLERFKSTASRQSVATACADTAIRYSGRGLATRADALDTEPEVLWAGGVPWDLRASRNGPVRAALSRYQPHLMSAAVVPDLSGPHDRWDALTAAIWPDERGREWALQVLAVAFTGYSDAVMPILMGDPGRGKTHLVKRLIDVLGGNTSWSYGGVMNADLLRSDAKLHGTFTLDLKGKRLAFIDEAPGHGLAAQRRLKSLTGGGALQGNRMRENPVSFAPTHTLVMTANHEDPPPLDEPALQRRARLIFFEGDLAAVDAASRDIDGGEPQRAAWRKEMPWVLARMMQLAAAWLDNRGVADADRAPLDWQNKKDTEISTQDPVLAWLDSGEVAPDPAGTRSSVLRENFVSWCKNQGLAAPTVTKWGRRLTELGFPVTGRDAGGRYRPLKPVLPGAADFMHGSGGRSTMQQTVHPENPQVSGSSMYSLYSLYSKNNTTQEESINNPLAPPTSTHINKGESGKTEQPCTAPENVWSDLGIHSSVHGSETMQDSAQPGTTPLASKPHTPYRKSGAEPAATHKSRPAETGKNDKIVEKPKTPPSGKNPKNRLSEEEKLARAQARKERLAAERLAARQARITELGGPLVPLPAVVLRDQRVLPVTPEAAARWLEGCLAELSVDVEHTGYPRTHKDYRLRLVQLGNEGSAVVLDPADPAQAAVIRDALASATVLHAHSALADLIPLEATGLGDASMWDKMIDTVNIAKLSDPALCDSDEAGLKALARNLLGPDYALSWRLDELRKEIFAAGGWIGDCEVTTPAERSGWASIPLCESFVRYSASDVLDCAAVARVLGGGPVGG
jgi:hypothetical protein